MILLDSDHFSVISDPRDRHHEALCRRLNEILGSIALPVVVVEEHLRGWLALVHKVKAARRLVTPYERLTRFLLNVAQWEIAPWTTNAADLFDHLRTQRIRIGTHDLRIASLALSEDALLLSSNLRDFEQVPNLQVEDWLRP